MNAPHPLPAPGPGRPTPPIALAGGPATARLGARAVPVPDDLARRLGDICAVSDAAAELDEVSRDWWPQAMTWALDGQVAARAALVARPTAPEQVAEVLRACHEARVPVTAAAGRSGVCGASVPLHGGVVLDLCGLAGVVDVDETSLVLDVRPGTFGDHLEHQLRTEHGLTLGHWPQSVALSTVGGWLACRSAGQLSTRYGKIEDMVVALDVVLPSGELVTLGESSRAAVGPDLRQLMVGSEGMLGVITSVTLQTHPLPDHGGAVAYRFRDFAAGLAACRELLQQGARPAVVRLYDAAESRHHFDVDAAVLLIADEGTPALVDATLRLAREVCAVSGQELDSDAIFERWLDTRYVIPPLHEHPRRERVVYDTLEMMGGWATTAAVYDDVVASVGAIPGTVSVSGHQSHSYPDGACIYFTMQGDVDPDERDAWYRAAWDAAHAAIIRHGATVSHHHGVGLVRAPYMRESLGDGAFELLRTVKAALDPAGILNPGKFGL